MEQTNYYHNFKIIIYFICFYQVASKITTTKNDKTLYGM
jgi:hypothetical protein